MSKLHRATLLCLSAALAVALSSCDNSYGSLASVQAEIAQKGTDTFKETMVTRVLRFSGSYYASIAKLFVRPAAGGSWSRVPIADSSDYSLLAIASDGSSALYAAILDSAGANRLYSYDGSAWAELGGIPSGAIVDGLFCANGRLFAEAHYGYDNEDNLVDDTYSLYYLAGTSLAACGATLQGMAAPFVDLAWDGSAYWVATTKALYQVASTPDGAVSDQTSSSGISSVSYSSITSLHYSTSDSAVYAGAYTGYVIKCSGASGVGTYQDLGSAPVTAIADLGSSTLLAGLGTTDSADEGGYYEGAFGSLAEGDGGTFSQYSSTVYGTAITCIFWDAADSRVFFCDAPGYSSNKYGLYSATTSATDLTAE